MPATTFQEDIAESRRLKPQDESIEMNLEENDELVQPCAAPRISPCRLRVQGLKRKRRKEENDSGQLQCQERLVSLDRSLEGAARTDAPKGWGTLRD